MYEPPYVTYIQNLSDEDLVDIIKDLIGLRMTGCLNKDSKFRDCVSAVKDFFKDFESPQTSPDLIAEKVVKDEVFKRYVEIYDAQSKTLVSCNIRTPYTNGDKIRSMTDEKLEKWLCNIMSLNCCMRTCPDRHMCKISGDGLIEWLKQPVKED